MSVPAAITGLIFIWATTPLAIKWSSVDAGVMFSLSSRMVLGVLLCLLLVLLMRVPLKWHREARLAYLASGLGLYSAMTAVYWGAQYISSGLVSVVYGLLPMMTFFCAVLILRENPWQPAKLLGSALGFAGLLVIFNPQDQLDQDMLLGVGLVLLSVLFHALSMVAIKRIGSGMHALSLTTGGLLVAVPLYLLSWWWSGDPPPTELSERSLWSIIYLGVMGSVLGFVLFYYALKQVSASSIALLTLVTPVLALGLGHWLNHESLQAEIIGGAALVLSGLAMHHWGGLLWSRLRR